MASPPFTESMQKFEEVEQGRLEARVAPLKPDQRGITVPAGFRRDLVEEGPQAGGAVGGDGGRLRINKA